MGVKEIRTASKVDLGKHAWDQPCLHVCQIYIQISNTKLTMIPESMAPRQYADFQLTLRCILRCIYIVVPATGTISNNEVVKIECIDWTGGQINNNDSADDIKNVDLTRIHYMSGPFHIETAEPGDVLLVEVQDVQPLQDHPWGFTGVFHRHNGGGFLDEKYPEAYVQPTCLHFG